MSVESSMTRIVVIPCYNEATRLDPERVLALASVPDIVALLVDDGSTDETLTVLNGIADRSSGAVRVLRLPENMGKGEAVRMGLLHALRDGANVVGYLDADFSTPPAEMVRVLDALRDPNIDVALGARVRLLGRHIDRRPARHLLGRVFATASSLALDLPVYDTQCGAKAMRRTPRLEAALAEPFLSRWAFDVELIGRLSQATPADPSVPDGRIVEVPLAEWRDVGGSRMSGADMAKAAVDLWRIARRLRR